jgi:hypothetical protein
MSSESDILHRRERLFFGFKKTHKNHSPRFSAVLSVSAVRRTPPVIVTEFREIPVRIRDKARKMRYTVVIYGTDITTLRSAGN